METQEKIICEACCNKCNSSSNFHTNHCNEFKTFFLKNYYNFICKKCLKKLNNVIILDDSSELFDYFTFYKMFKEIKFNLLESYIKINQKKFSDKISSNILEEINPIAYQTLKNSKHFGIRKEKLRIAEKYVHQVQKETLQNLNIALLEDELACLCRKKILDLQVDILYLKKHCKDRYLHVYIPLPDNPEFYKKEVEYTIIANEAVPDGSNLLYTKKDLNLLFVNMPSRILNSDIWN